MNLKFGKVDSEQSFKEFVAFAKTFDHDEGDHSILPAYTVRKDGELIAYFKPLLHPVIFPAFHPEKCSHRDFSDIVSHVKAWQSINTISDRFPNGTCFIAVENEPAIDKITIAKLGFKDLGVQVWQERS